MKTIRKLLLGVSGLDPGNFLPILNKKNKEIAPGSPGAGSWLFSPDVLMKTLRKLLLGVPGLDPDNFLPMPYEKQ